MANLKILLLPGLDGDGFYSEPLREMLSAGHPCQRLSYPSQLYTYESLCEWVCEQLDLESDYIIVGESFGGPLAVLVAEALEDQAKALVLCASFCRTPRPRFLLSLAAWLCPLFLPFDWVAHAVNFLLCNGENIFLSRKLQSKLKIFPESTIGGRIRAVRDIDVRPESAALTLPLLIISAKNDPILKSSRFTHLTDAQILFLDGPHMLTGLRQSAVAEAISAFIKAKI